MPYILMEIESADFYGIALSTAQCLIFLECIKFCLITENYMLLYPIRFIIN